MNEEESRLKSKRVHALVMIILGAIMSVCALAAGLIAMSPGVFPSWMTGGWDKRRKPAYRTPAKVKTYFSDFGAAALARAKRQHKLVLLHLAPCWSREARLMEETTYADAAAAKWIAEHVVATRADAEERPDLALRYGAGAWPTTVLIHSDGRALAIAYRLTPKLFLPWAELIAQTLNSDPAKAEGFAADAERRREAVRRRPALATGPDDPVWGGVYHSPSEYAKILSDQTAAVLAGDNRRAQSVLNFTERFMSLPGGGYASSVSGDVYLSNGSIEEGSSYFSKDDAGRRADALPSVDRRIFAGSNSAMAHAVLLSQAASKSQKAHARRTLKYLSNPKNAALFLPAIDASR